MDKVVLDSDTLAKMSGHDVPFEVWSKSGLLIGVFHPKKKPTPTRPPMTDEEIEAAIARSKGGRRYTAAEVRAEDVEGAAAMNYGVLWEDEPFAHLIRLWLRAADPERVMDAYDDVTRLLAESPGEQGESRSSPMVRLWYHAPFELYFRIDEKQHEVAVIEVRWIGD